MDLYLVIITLLLYFFFFLRNRTMKVYEIFSRKDAASVYITLRNMSVGYVVLEEPLCLGYANV